MATLLAIGVAFLTYSCNSSLEESEEGNTGNYTDIPLYFQKQIDELNHANPLILKTVVSNNDKETREVHIKDWTNELSSFLTTDLNKPAYQGHVSKDSSANIVTYSLSGKNIDPTTVIIKYDSSTLVKSFAIERTTQNFLYTTTEKLNFEKGRSYSIEKKQKVLFIGVNDYSINGIIK